MQDASVLRELRDFVDLHLLPQFWSKLSTEHGIKMQRNAKQLFPGMLAAPVCKLLESVMISRGEREWGKPLGFSTTWICNLQGDLENSTFLSFNPHIQIMHWPEVSRVFPSLK